MKAAKTMLFATAATLALTGAVVAQDWSGFYGGMAVGYATGDADHSFSNAAPSGNSEPDGLLLGGFAGYAWQSGNFVYGGEIDLEASRYNGSFTDNTGATSRGEIDGNWQGSIRGVVGFPGTLSKYPTLYYATAGWATGDFDFRGGPAAALGADGYSERLTGWTAGFGMDMRYDAQTSLRVEYRYTDFGTASGTLDPGFPAVTMPVDVTQHAVRFGLRLDF
jgi:outer membrane immunogenic protein